MLELEDFTALEEDFGILELEEKPGPSPIELDEATELEDFTTLEEEDFTVLEEDFGVLELEEFTLMEEELSSSSSDSSEITVHVESPATLIGLLRDLNGQAMILYIWRMDQNQLFTLALGITQPWKIESVEFSATQKRLDIIIDFAPGSRFRLGGESKDENSYPAYDTVEKQWRHLDFFQHECYIKARTPRVKKEDGSIQLVTPPWAGREKGFTLLFEALLLQLLKCMAVKQVERLCRIDDDKLWHMIRHYVDDARKILDMSMLQALGVDETSIRKGHKYVTLFVDTEKSRTLFVTEGKDSSTFSAFEADLMNHGGEASQVSTISMDMSPAFIKGADSHFPSAQKVFDRFHIVKLFNAAVDGVRRREQKESGKETGKLLKDARWAVLKNRSNLTEKQKVTSASIEMHGRNLMTFKMLRMRESLQDAYRLATSASDFEARLKALRRWLLRSRLEPAVELGNMMKEHWLGILSWFRLKISNAILEGLNSLVKAAAARARGFRTIRNYTTIIYLITGKLNFATINPVLGKC